MASIEVTPRDALIDVERRIQIVGLVPGERIRLTASSRQPDGAVWTSRASFQADHQGQIDLTIHAPLEAAGVSNDYHGVSPMGMVHAMTPETGDIQPPLTPVEPVEVELCAMSGGGEERASGRFIQRYLGEGVQRREIRQAGLSGTLFLPAGEGPFPAVMVLNGSGGGISEARGALYASHGYAALALGYFKAPGRPDYISNTPLEYFVDALDWLREEVSPLNGFVALSGQSRGGELVLLLASLFPERVSAVVGYVPSAFVHPAQNAADPAVGREGPCWLLDGKRLPDLWQDNPRASWAPYDDGPEPKRHAYALLTALEDQDACDRARMPVERIRAPILLLSASDDGSWPSAQFARMIEMRLAAHDHPYPVEHHCYRDAGHAIVFPHLPTTAIVRPHPVSGILSSGGGSMRDNARANQESWPRVLSFLARAVAASCSEVRPFSIHGENP